MRKTRRYSFLILTCSLILWGCRSNRNPVVVLSSKYGAIYLEIYQDKAPVTATNFLSLVKSGAYQNGVFYRVVRLDNQPHNKVKIEVVQAGLFVDSLIEQYPAIPHETTQVSKVLHKDGVVSMARLAPGSASTEFFICVGDQPELDFGGKRNPDGQGFAAFGKVVDGMDVVREIQQLSDHEQYLENMVPFVIRLN